jgi:hypothetical protein
MRESRWPIVKTIAWIAWRDPDLVSAQGADFRSQCTRWVLKEWQQPEPDGKSSIARVGWFLEPSPGATSLQLSGIDRRLRREGSLPVSARLAPDQAIAELWGFLSEGRLVADGFDRDGRLVEIPAMEWSRLQLFQEDDQDVLKYHGLDCDGPYHDIELRRADVTSLWPRYVPIEIDSLDLGNLTRIQIELMTGNDAYIPLSVALCWVITDRGQKDVSLRDETAWKTGVGRLMPKICDGSIEIIGRDLEQIGKTLPSTAFDSIDVPHPLNIPHLFDASTFIQSNLFTGDGSWKCEGGDQFFSAGSARPRWTHLKVHRAQVLRLWPIPMGTSKARLECERWLCEKIKESPVRQPKSKSAFSKEARQKFYQLSVRQFDLAWATAIAKSEAVGWSKAGRLRGKSKHCAK